MSKPLNKMTKAELLGLIHQQSLRIQNQDQQITQLQGQIARGAAPVREQQHMGKLAQQYCQAHGVRSVDRSTLLHWAGGR